MLRKTRSFVLYPEYFDKKLSKKEGRKVSRSKAVEECNLSKIVYACKYLELNYTIEKDKRYSKNWWKSEGRIVVNPEGIASKTELIRRVTNVARKLKKVGKPTQKKTKSKPK
ncbi:MAG: signal recognition particle subunit SRP19/SEC65 family protein [Candidatus Heimdallarchaeota archaeon]|nr:signal recognition particle subunit SRP19/SEC65 family protein [Candidatus Heimdallarchaeota archaeon]